MSENNRPDSEQKKDQTTAEDILAQVDSILADLENSAVAQLFAAPEKPKPEENKKPPEKEESAPPGEPEPPDKNAELCSREFCKGDNHILFAAGCGPCTAKLLFSVSSSCRQLPVRLALNAHRPTLLSVFYFGVPPNCFRSCRCELL